MDEREEMEAFARIEWPGVLVRVKMHGQPATIARVAADRLEEVERRWLEKYPPIASTSLSRLSSARPTGQGIGRRKRAQ